MKPAQRISVPRPEKDGSNRGCVPVRADEDIATRYRSIGERDRHPLRILIQTDELMTGMQRTFIIRSDGLP